MHSHQSFGHGVSEPPKQAAQALSPWQVLGAGTAGPPERMTVTLSLLEAKPGYGQSSHHLQLHLPVSTMGHRAAAVPAGAQGSAEPDIHLQVLESLKREKPPFARESILSVLSQVEA